MIPSSCTLAQIRLVKWNQQPFIFYIGVNCLESVSQSDKTNVGLKLGKVEFFVILQYTVPNFEMSKDYVLLGVYQQLRKLSIVYKTGLER